MSPYHTTAPTTKTPKIPAGGSWPPRDPNNVTGNAIVVTIINGDVLKRNAVGASQGNDTIGNYVLMHPFYDGRLWHMPGKGAIDDDWLGTRPARDAGSWLNGKTFTCGNNAWKPPKVTPRPIDDTPYRPVQPGFVPKPVTQPSPGQPIPPGTTPPPISEDPSNWLRVHWANFKDQLTNDEGKYGLKAYAIGGVVVLAGYSYVSTGSVNPIPTVRSLISNRSSNGRF